jgi:hypothetical protein
MFPHHTGCAHGVLFYKDDSSLRDAVAHHISRALRAGEPGLLIAKPALLRQVAIELHRQHVQGVPFGPERGPFVGLDAEQTLNSICLNGKPDIGRFNDVVGRALASLSGSGKRVAAYGEMVGLLCERGQYADAVRLEGMWNELLKTSNAALYCGYARGLFTSTATRRFYDDIRAAHTEVLEGTGAAATA